MVFAFVGDSTMTSAPPFAGAASVASISAGGVSAGFLRGARFFFGFTSASLSGTYQPQFNLRGFASLPSGTRLRKLCDLGGDILRTFGFSQHRGVGFGVERIAGCEKLPHACQWIITH